MGKEGASSAEVTLEDLEELDAHAREAVERYLAQEAARRRQLQAEGIAAAKARGVRFGRPYVEPPEFFGDLVDAWQRKVLPLEEVLRICHMSETTFFRRLRRYRQECGIQS